jgi:hypothetical protein
LATYAPWPYLGPAYHGRTYHGHTLTMAIHLLWLCLLLPQREHGEAIGVMLTTQYRMHAAISDWSSAEFYAG